MATMTKRTKRNATSKPKPAKEHPLTRAHRKVWAAWRLLQSERLEPDDTNEWGAVRAINAEATQRLIDARYHLIQLANLLELADPTLTPDARVEYMLQHPRAYAVERGIAFGCAELVQLEVGQR